MQGRTIKLTVQGDVSADQFADLAHAIWSTVQAALSDASRFTLEVEGATRQELNDRWAEHGREVPWA